LFEEFGMEITREKIYEILDPFIEKFPLLKDVKDLIA
jgi:hypothetical protein